jgi:polyisoprenoid-binding protein YceI
MDTIHSDKSERDAQFDGRIMDVAQYPTGTFTLTSRRIIAHRRGSISRTVFPAVLV